MKSIITYFQYLLSVLILFIIITLSSCEYDAFDEGKTGSFYISTDTVMFDTIFTGIGTPTYKLLVKNPNNFNLLFDSIYLANPSTSGFVVNINGLSSAPRRLTLDKKDSLYIFIQALIPVGQGSTPLANEDSLVFVSGNSIKKVRLIAFGQNTIHFRDTTIHTQEWAGEKPFLIYGSLTVEEGHKLTIREGVKVYMHRNSRILVKGTIDIKGSYLLPVNFSSDRLEKDYDTIPGQWGGLQITGTSATHHIHHAIIRNATTGILLGDHNSSGEVKVNMENTLIANMAYSAIIAYQASITANNLVLANTANATCALYGGNYQFTHCTFANYGAKYVARSIDSKSLLLSNYLEFTNSENKQVTLLKDLTKAEFRNTIVYGSSQNEIKIQKKEGSLLVSQFENCLLRISSPDEIAGSDNIFNKSPRFIAPEKENFRIDSLSPAKNAGKSIFGAEVPSDLDNYLRTADLAPDIGAYERKDKQ